MRVAVRKGEDGNLGYGLDVLERQSLGVLGGPNAGRERIAGIEGVIHDATALHALAGTKGSGGENVALKITVSAWIGVDQAAHRPMLCPYFRLDPPPRSPVASDDNGAFDGNPQPLELLVILGHAVIDVNQRPRNVPIRRIGIVSG